MIDRPPVFVWPMARSGGTLFTTILGVHSQVAMSYEIYEEELRNPDNSVASAAALLQTLKRLAAAGLDEKSFYAAFPRGRLRSFMARAHRGGLGPAAVIEVLQGFVDGGGSFEEIDGRLDFIEALMRAKMLRESKLVWGGKAKVSLDLIGRRHPAACVFMMVRDGRDILASRMNVGNFSTDPATVAEEWITALGQFEVFASVHSGTAMVIQYERLVESAESVLREACAAANVEFEAGMLTYEHAPLSLLDNPFGHLSAKRISEGINGGTVGRWERDLDVAAVKSFEAVAGEKLREYCYLVS